MALITTMGWGLAGGAAAEPVPLPGLNATQLRLFQAGQEEFEEVENPSEGLGPFFNERGCAACHSHPTTGGVTLDLTLREMRIGQTGRDGKFDPMLAFGGPVLHRVGIGDVIGELSEDERAVLPEACRRVHGSTQPPREAQFVSFRIPTPTFGAGLIEAIPADTIKRLALPTIEKRRHGILGRPNLIGETVGRFGWKAHLATLFTFSADAYRTEMGITNPDAPTEAHAWHRGPNGQAAQECDTRQGLQEPEDNGDAVIAFANFMRLLAPLPRGPITPEVERGERLFQVAGCHLCHVPELRTGPNRVAALDQKPVRLFSDLLLHDLGDALADGIVQESATGREFRTAPLWGLRFRQAALMHDGRATNLLKAIRLHQGEAASSSHHVFRSFTSADREALMAFLRSL